MLLLDYSFYHGLHFLNLSIHLSVDPINFGLYLIKLRFHSAFYNVHFVLDRLSIGYNLVTEQLLESDDPLTSFANRSWDVVPLFFYD